MPQLFSNNARSTLNGSITNVATTINLAAGTGARFPNPTGGDWFLATLWEMSGTSEVNHEIVKVTARATDALTVVRAQEGTTGRAFGNNNPIECRWTAAAAALAGAALPLAGGTMTGAIAMGNNNVAGVKTVTFNGAIDNSNFGATKTIDWTAGLYQKGVMSANCVFTFTPPAGPAMCHLEITQGAGAYTMTLPTGKWDESYTAADKLLSTTNGKIDLLVARWNGTFWMYQLAKGWA